MHFRAPCLVASAVFLSACGSSRVPEVHAGTDNDTRQQVAVVKAARQDLARGMELSAEFRPYQEIDLHAKVAGYVKTIYADVGDHVRAGQLIAVLEVPEFVEELAQASASEKRSELHVVRAESEVLAQNRRTISASFHYHLGVSGIRA